MNILVDTSVWVAHFKSTNIQLSELLSQDQVITHSMIIGELACGTPPAPRQQTLNDIQLLTFAKQATFEEVLNFIETEKLYGLGCAYIDISLLASTLITPNAKLWSYDKALSRLALRFRISFLTEY